MEEVKKFNWQMVRELADMFYGEEFLGKRAREYIDKKFQKLNESKKQALLTYVEEYIFIKKVFAKKHFDIWLLSSNNSMIYEYYYKILPSTSSRKGIICDLINSRFVDDIVNNKLQEIIAPFINEADIENFNLAASKQEKTEALFQTAKRICSENELEIRRKPAFGRIMHFISVQIQNKNTAKEIREDKLIKTKNFLTRMWGKLKK